MLQHALPLNAFYDIGDKIGGALAYVFFFLMLIGFIFVMSKYLGGSDEKKGSRA